MTIETTTTETTTTEITPATETGGSGGGEQTKGSPPPWDGFVAMEARPDGVPDNYWDAEKGGLKVGAVLKRAGDLQRKVTELTTPKAPAEAYAFNPPAHLKDHVTGDEPLFGRMGEWAKKHDLPQAAIDELVGVYYGDLPTLDGLAEGLKGEHGDHAKAVIEANAKWLGTVKDAGIRDALDTLVLTPDGHRALKWLREGLNGGRAIEDRNGAGAGDKTPTYEDILAMKRDPRYWRDNDPAYIRQVKELLAKAFPGESQIAPINRT